MVIHSNKPESELNEGKVRIRIKLMVAGSADRSYYARRDSGDYTSFSLSMR
jgi:hypothetical protein